MKLAPGPLRKEIDHGIDRADVTYFLSLRYGGYNKDDGGRILKKGAGKNKAIAAIVKFGLAIGPDDKGAAVCFSFGKKPEGSFELLQRIRGVVDAIGVSKLVGPGNLISKKALRDHKREQDQSERKEELARKESKKRVHELLPLRDFLGRTRKECDHSLRRTKEWCRKNGATLEYREGYVWPFVNGIYLGGGGCDCEVWMNSVQTKEEAKA